MNIDNYGEVKRLLNEADAVIIGAGSGLSTAAGLDYGPEHFQQNFPELVKHYGFTDMYTSSFATFETEEERWSYWAKHIYAFSLGISATKTYQSLFDLVKDKNYFVITTNVEEQFSKAGFQADRIFEVQGTLSKIQCAKECHDVLYDSKELIRKMIEENDDNKVPSSLVPVCPVCHGKMEVHLRKDEFFIEDDTWHQSLEQYQTFLNDNATKKVLFLELGVGFNTPGIIRYPFEEYTYRMKKATLVRVNKVFPQIPEELSTKGISFAQDCSQFIEALKNHA